MTTERTETPIASDPPQRFEVALTGLEQAVQRLESGELSLDEALACYEQGLALLLHCRRLLSDAEQRVALLTGVSDDGQPQTSPFNAAATFQPDAPSSPAPSRRSPPEKGEDPG